jgi:phosphoserine phosphatase RsbU/P
MFESPRMFRSAFQILAREYRTHRMARFTCLVLILGIALETADLFSLVVSGIWWLLFWLAIGVAALYYLVRLIGFVRHRLLWRLKRRLIVTYLFIAVVPAVLILLLTVVGAFIINGQFAAFLVNLRLRNHADELRQLDRVVIHEVHQSAPTDAAKLLEGLQRFYVSELSKYGSSYPGLEITLRMGSQTRAFRLDGTTVERPISVPSWLTSEEFTDVVVDHGQVALRSFAQTQLSNGALVVILSQPITPTLLDIVGEGIGPVGILVPHVARNEGQIPGGSAGSQGGESTQVPAGTITSETVPLPRGAVYLLDYQVRGYSTLEPIVWNSEKGERLGEPVLVYASSRIVALNRQLISTLGRFSQIYVTAFLALAAIFLIIEVLALIVGVRLTRTMTSTVDKLYDATERVKAGDFSYRIGLRAEDQLSALGEAFDSTTASVERLLRESKEKSKLESELAIAREVQNQLFPLKTPEIKGFELFGVCKPASGVSGDYYDFLRLSEDRVGLVLGDVSGKGISAALMMATIQSAVHAQFYDGHSSSVVGQAQANSTAEIVARLNSQLYESTPMEKYATFFYALYDPCTYRLTYTNAGHLAPALFRKGSVERLKVGGTVVGLFPAQEYEQASLQLEPGDLLLAFTDGLTEPENTYGEEFGEERLFKAAQRALAGPPEGIVEEIYRSVSDWTGSPELQDDMTLIIARRLE